MKLHHGDTKEIRDLVDEHIFNTRQREGLRATIHSLITCHDLRGLRNEEIRYRINKLREARKSRR